MSQNIARRFIDNYSSAMQFHGPTYIESVNQWFVIYFDFLVIVLNQNKHHLISKEFFFGSFEFNTLEM